MLGAGSSESARELCKAKELWDNANTSIEYLAALQISDGIARIAFSDSQDRVDKEAYEELLSGYKYRKNNLIWAIGVKKATEDNTKKTRSSKRQDWSSFEDKTSRAKKRLFVRFAHLMKPFPKSWEFD